MLKGYRTYVVSALVVGFGFLAQVDWVKVMENPKDGVYLVGTGLLMALMRSITTTAPAKDSAEPSTEKGDGSAGAQ